MVLRMIMEMRITALKKCILMINTFNNGMNINKININSQLYKRRISFYKVQLCKIIQHSLINIRLIILMCGISSILKLA